MSLLLKVDPSLEKKRELHFLSEIRNTHKPFQKYQSKLRHLQYHNLELEKVELKPLGLSGFSSG